MKHPLKTLTVLTLCAFALSACSSSGIKNLLEDLDKKDNEVVQPGTGTDNPGNGSTQNNGSTQPGVPGGSVSDGSGNTIKTYVLSADQERLKAEIVGKTLSLVDEARGVYDKFEEPNGTVRYNVPYTVTELSLSLNGKTYQGKRVGNDMVATIDPKDLKLGYTGTSVLSTYRDSAGVANKTEGNVKIYNMPYSLASGKYNHRVSALSGAGSENVDERDTTYGGIFTTVLPENNTYTYNGLAFNKDEKGSLEYNITFAANNSGKGEGKITGMNSYGDIALKEGNIGQLEGVSFNGDLRSYKFFGIKGGAAFKDGTGSYELGIFGPAAEEIAGKVTTSRQYQAHPEDPDMTSGPDGSLVPSLTKDEIGFAGQR